MSQRTMGFGRRWAKRTLVAVVVVATVLAILYAALDEPLPKGREGPEAEALAGRMLDAVNASAWDSRTMAVRFSFGADHRYLWDRERGVVEVRWDDLRVLAHEYEARGLALRAGEVLGDAEAREALKTARRIFVNDSYWLNPVVKIDDPGVRRAIVELDDGQRGLLVTYPSGGVTPGDSYLWEVDADGLPTAFRLWVSMIPIGGARITWQGWITLATGAKISTEHGAGPVSLDLIHDVEAASSLDELIGRRDDPFGPLLESG